MVNSNSTESKRNVREELHKFISFHYTEQQLQNAKVLTLISDKPYELEEIWDKLGVPRANITTVEKDSSARERIKNSNSGIRLIEDYSNIDDFIADTNEKFDIINLDYNGNLNNTQMRTIQNIASKEMLGPQGILATWFSGRREKDNTKDLLLGNYGCILSAMKMIKNDISMNMPNIHRIKKIATEMNQMTQSDIERSESITHALTTHLFYEDTGERQIPKIIKLIHGEEKLVNAIESTEKYKSDMKLLLQHSSNETAFKERFGTKALAVFKNIRAKKLAREEPDFNDRLEMAKYFIGEVDAYNASINIMKSWVIKELSSRKIIIPAHIDTITHILYHQGMKYLTFDNERFFYLGDNSTPMFVDFILAGKKEFKDYYWHIKDGKIKLQPGTLANFGLRELNRTIQYMHLMNQASVFGMDDRITITPDYGKKSEDIQIKVFGLSLEDIAEICDAGIEKENSPEPKQETNYPASAKERIYALLQEGKTTEEIIKIYPEYSAHKIGSYKAWLKMKSSPDAKKGGRQKKNKDAVSLDSIANESAQAINQTETAENTQSASGLSKEEILLLIKDGYSSKEIASTFPGTDVYQIRGYLAGQTRKMNKEKTKYNKAS